MIKDRKLIIILVIFGLMVLLLTHLSPASDNATSRLFTSQSLLRDNNFALFEGLARDEHQLVDNIYDGNNWYSNKPPLMSLLTAGVYKVLFRDTLNFLTPTAVVNMSYNFYIIVLIFSGIPYILLLIFFFKALILARVTNTHALIFTSYLGVGTMVFPFATVYAVHLLVALSWFMGFYFMLKYYFDGRKSMWLLVYSGLSLGFGAVLESAATIFLILPMILYIYSKQKSLNELLVFISGLIPWSLIGGTLNSIATGSILPLHLQYHLYRHLPENIHTFDMHILGYFDIFKNYFYALVFDKRALLSTNPLSFIAFIATVFLTFNKRIFSKEILVVASSSLTFFLLIFSISGDFGGGTRTLRWMLPFVPLWMWILAVHYTSMHRLIRLAILIVGFLSIGISVPMAIDPWVNGNDYTLLNYIINKI